MELSNGYLIVLPREEAKKFFGHRQDEPRLKYIGELLGDEAVQRLSCEGEWQKMHDALAAVDVESSVLAQAILGGRPLHQGDDHHVCLVRPDVVGFIAEQLGSTAIDFGELTDKIAAVHETYKAAAEVGGATVFVAKK